jgi:autotransporter passenger strand-loop-strand repeat protein
VISSGGRQYVLSGGIDRGTIISAGGLAFISSGGTISGGKLISGATLTVSSGGYVSAGLTISAGTANLYGNVSAGVNFAGSGGDLALYNLAAFHATIGGFSTGDMFDLGGFSYSSAETVSFTEAGSLTSGTLQVTDGGLTANLTLVGGYATSNFALSNDGHGGTFVKYV